VQIEAERKEGALTRVKVRSRRWVGTGSWRSSYKLAGTSYFELYDFPQKRSQAEYHPHCKCKDQHCIRFLAVRIRTNNFINLLIRLRQI